MLSRLIALVAPPLCLACSAYAGRAGLLCRDCRAQMQATHSGWVRLPTAGSAAPPASGALPASGPPPASGARIGSGAALASAARCWTAFAYEGPAGAVVRALKFRGRVAVADFMAAQLAALAPGDLLHGTIVPVPVHPAHARRRGVDHSGALARALSERTGLPLAACLVRSGDPRPQVGRGRQQRIRGPAGAIAMRQRADSPESALLVDDVVTTGATLAACIAALAASGTHASAAVAYAHTTAR